MEQVGSPLVVILFWAVLIAVIWLVGWRVLTSYRSGVPSRLRGAAIMASALSSLVCVWFVVQAVVASHYEMEKSIVYLSVFLFVVALFGVGYFALAAIRGVYRLEGETSPYTSPEALVAGVEAGNLRRQTIRAGMILVAVLVVPMLFILVLRSISSGGAVLIAMWWQPLVVPYATTFSDRESLPAPAAIATIQWAIVTVVFSFLSRRWRPWQQVLAAIATMVCVGLFSHLVLSLLGFDFYFDGP